jgi:DNA-binding transcriptional LysR family regulator
MLNTNQLNSFVKAVEYKSLNKAAKDLFISQPALSKQLAELEKQLNCKLFFRKQTGVEVTDVGRLLYEKATFILSQINLLEVEIETFSKKKHLTIGTLPSISSNYLPSILNKFESRGYEVQVLIRGTSLQLLQMLANEEIEVGFIQDAANFSHDLHQKNILTEPYWALLSKNHPMNTQDEIDIEHLIQNKIILYKDPCDIRTSFRILCNSIGLQPTKGMELEFNDSVHSFVALNHGVSIVPEMVAKQLIHPLLVVKPIRSPIPFPAYSRHGSPTPPSSGRIDTYDIELND